MNSIRVNILGKAYPLRVEPGEEQAMQEIADYVDERFKLFKRELSTQPEQTIMVLACLSIAEELFAQRRSNNQAADHNTSSVEHDPHLDEISTRLQKILGDINKEI
ncbi:MAG: cell division protein ZapA [Bacteroidetes bacterium]|nr:cell division protein ZapA [Bacteroidota bacterium]MCH8523238.1 cell division protein ZapA [Balneolales bacterium]